MGSKVSIVDLVHALFKSNVVDICQKGDEYFIGNRMSEKISYPDERKILYTINIEGAGSTADILKKLGAFIPPNRPYFMEGDKEKIAELLLEDIKQKFPNWADFLDDKIVFKKGGKGYL
jgi:hypothetical protein